jgi:hypothetical protein
MLTINESDFMSVEEWNELNVLREAISYNPATVSTEKQERFTELLVKSLSGKGDYVSYNEPSNY